MTKRIEIDGKYYRQRRGKTVEIPVHWVGKVLFEQTKRKRPSKAINRQAREIERHNYPDSGNANPYAKGPRRLDEKFHKSRNALLDVPEYPIRPMAQKKKRFK